MIYIVVSILLQILATNLDLGSEATEILEYQILISLTEQMTRKNLISGKKNTSTALYGKGDRKSSRYSDKKDCE